MSKIILHIDMDAFFASVEARDNPSLKGVPIAVAGANERTVIVSPSYEARKFGVKTGMTKFAGKRLCPSIQFVSADSQKYAKACSDIAAILYRFTPYIEVYSIDEFFLDITNTYHLFGSPRETAFKMKQAIKSEIGLPCTIGISHNKLLAKIASDTNKPDGLFVINKRNQNRVIGCLDVASIWGIGPSTAKKLYNFGVHTLSDLKDVGYEFLKKRFGVYGTALHNISNGVWDDEIITSENQEVAKSMGHSMTFANDTKDISVLKKYMLDLSKMVASRLRREDLAGRCISLTVRYKSFETFSRQKSISIRTNTTGVIYKTALGILKSIDLKEPVRLLGVSVSGLICNEYKHFLFKEDQKRHDIGVVLDDINLRFGRSAINFASLVNKQEHKKVISPAWRPQGARNY